MFAACCVAADDNYPTTQPKFLAKYPDICSSSVCAADICPDGMGRRQIGDDCCVCPDDCSSTPCPPFMCPDGTLPQQIGGDCCACPDKCSSTLCQQDVCPDGKARRQIGDDCCACPEAAHRIKATNQFKTLVGLADHCAPWTSQCKGGIGQGYGECMADANVKCCEAVLGYDTKACCDWLIDEAFQNHVPSCKSATPAPTTSFIPGSRMCDASTTPKQMCPTPSGEVECPDCGATNCACPSFPGYQCKHGTHPVQLCPGGHPCPQCGAAHCECFP